MSFYTRKGTKIHSQINNYYKTKKPYTGDTNLKKILKQIEESEQWSIVDTEILVTNQDNISGKIDALYKREQENEFIIVDWKYSRYIPTERSLHKYEKIELNRLTKFHKDTILKYILQINMYKLLLLSSDIEKINKKLHLFSNVNSNLNWNNVKLCIIFLNQTKCGDYTYCIYECKQFSEIDLMSLLNSRAIRKYKCK